MNGLKRYDEAIQYFDKALEIDPNDIFALSNKGYGLARQKKYIEAIQYCERALEINPSAAFTWYNKARIEALNNRLASSIKSLENAIKFYNIYKEEAKEELDFDIIRNTDEFKNLIYEE